MFQRNNFVPIMKKNCERTAKKIHGPAPPAPSLCSGHASDPKRRLRSVACQPATGAQPLTRHQLAARTARQLIWSVPNNPLRQRGIITDADGDLACDPEPICLIFSRDLFSRVIHQSLSKKRRKKSTSKLLVIRCYLAWPLVNLSHRAV